MNQMIMLLFASQMGWAGDKIHKTTMDDLVYHPGDPQPVMTYYVPARDLFAGLAMQAIITATMEKQKDGSWTAAKTDTMMSAAVMYADSLVKALDAPPPKEKKK